MRGRGEDWQGDSEKTPPQDLFLFTSFPIDAEINDDE